ncbi:MAG TPA: nitrite reductase (NAD(P)H) small subunit [Ignavibacteria bacterium]|nr:nitrite reductase (NAD(P)H) small subunit [Ignavibacteria bacterium]
MEEEYIKICKVSEVYNRKGKPFQLDDENEIALFKVDGIVYAVDNICPHNHTSQMYDGYIEEMYVACPVHGFQFHLATGEQPTKMGCKLRTFEVKVIDEYVYVKKPSVKRFDFNF